MTVNTAKKRKSISGIPFLFAPGVTPNAAKDQDWRFSAAGSYAGGYLYNLNTAKKRKMASGIYPFLPVGVTPNSTKNATWRASAGWGYIPTGRIARSVRSVHVTERRKIHRTE